MKEIFERVIELAEYYRVSKPSEFAKKTGFSHQVATNYLKGKRNPTRESINTILVAFPEINGEWLLTGAGEMLKNHSNTIPIKLVEEIQSSNHSQDFKQKEIEMWKELYRMQAELMEEIKKDRDRLQRLVDEKKN